MTTTAVAERQAEGVPGITQDARANVSFARQPILNRDNMLCAFELKLYQPPAAESAEAEEDADSEQPKAGPSAAERFIQAVLQHDVRAALGNHPGYLPVTRELLFDHAIRSLPAERFMFELPADILADDTLIARIVELHGRRYRFVIDNVAQADETFARLLPYADAVKIDMNRIPQAMLPKFASVLKSAGKLLIAQGVESQEVFEQAFNLGFDRFQGFYFANPQGAAARKVSAPRHALLNLLQLLGGEPTVAQLEAELKLNPVLVMHLMRLANSSGLAMGRKVTTLREAINATGTNRIARWTQLLLYADGRKVALEDDPLLQLAATRARFMELAVERLPEAGRDETDAAFLTGVFSFVDSVFGGSLEHTLNVLALSKPIRDAILLREGALGTLLTLVEALERGAWAHIESACSGLDGVQVSDIAQMGLVAAAWAGIADRSAEATGLERIED
ncbi:EAL domain-containing protein [Paraburkholderia sp. Tr-20389]|uniref:EAL and HDOD domain-containing protein n=1 Tax=Paraburkholderia sp. Tr-20389 TaxID=2703903 RepID=UPI00197D20E0|nr:EAL domain-containing protein [Paraburkholderia sp. Tr-20389]MBN3754602.1 EAL domain-containing protein [Paraburkholderia sp. Tr-20389]